MTPNRIVAVLTPLVFAPLAGAVASWLAQHFPGIDVKQSDVQEIFIAGAAIALAPAAQWLHGWQKHEAREAETERAVAIANASAGAPAAPSFDEQLDTSAIEDRLDQFDDLDELDESDEELLGDEQPVQPAEG
jgi:hypothetical protein